MMMVCLSALSLAGASVMHAEENPLHDMEFFLFLAQSEQQGDELTTPLDLDDWEPTGDSEANDRKNTQQEEAIQ